MGRKILLAMLTDALLSAAIPIHSVSAQAAPAVSQAEVDQAIARGTQFLQNFYRGGFGNRPDETRIELLMYTFLHAGVPRDDKLFGEGLALLETKKLEKTYNVALTAMFFEGLDKVRYQWRLQQCAQFLVDNQCKNGQWSYGEPIEFPPGTPTGNPHGPTVESGPSRPGGSKTPSRGTQALKRIPIQRAKSRGPETGDHSNTQFALLGLRAAAGGGIVIPPDTWKDALRILKEAQDSDGSWAYTYVSPTAPNQSVRRGPGYGSMTAACLCSVILCEFFLGKNYKQSSNVRNALEWMAENFTVEENANFMKNPNTRPATPGTWHYYYLYGIERVGMIYGTEQIGKHSWYPVGARWLLDHQKPDGSWEGEQQDKVSDTCFAILFLRRATKPMDPRVYSK